MSKLKELIARYKDVILYLFFGVCTTLCNVVAYYLCVHLIGMAIMAGTVVAWAIAVLFAYLTNRKWVFGSEETAALGVAKEIAKFFACRLATGVVDWALMLIFAGLLGWNDLLIKIGANIIVIILNYVASKLIIFRKKKS